MVTVDEVRKLALTENDISVLFLEDSGLSNATRIIAGRFADEMMRSGGEIALGKLCNGELLEETRSSGVSDEDEGNSLNTYPFGTKPGGRYPEFIGVCAGPKRLYDVFKAVERQINSYNLPNSKYKDWDKMKKSITVFTDKWDPKYLEKYEVLYLEAILKRNVYFNFYLVTPYGITRIPFMNRQQVQNIKKQFGKQNVIVAQLDLASKYGISEAELVIKTYYSFAPSNEEHYHFDFGKLVYEYSSREKYKSGKLNKALANKFLSTAMEVSKAGALTKAERATGGSWYYLYFDSFKLEWQLFQEANDPYAEKMGRALRDLIHKSL